MAGAVAGGGTALFGLADAVEGGYDIYYGSMGDVDSASINYLKSVVFQGNETAYQITESVFAFTASALVPIGAASKSATLTFRSGAVAVGKLAISDAAGSLTSKVILESTGNRAASMLAGMAASTTTGFGLNALDSKYHISAGNSSGEVKAADTTSEGKRFKIVRTSSAEDVNKIFKEQYGYDPPYKPGTVVTEIQLTQDSTDGTYVRVYDKVNSRMQGAWVMKAEDIAGLTKLEIQNKYALPFTPEYICDVNLESETYLRNGIANSLFGFEGGGLQSDLFVNGSKVGEFINERIIGK